MHANSLTMCVEIRFDCIVAVAAAVRKSQSAFDNVFFSKGIWDKKPKIFFYLFLFLSLSLFNELKLRNDRFCNDRIFCFLFYVLEPLTIAV